MFKDRKIASSPLWKKKQKRGLGAEEGECERLKKKTVGRFNRESNFRGFNTELNMGERERGQIHGGMLDSQVMKSRLKIIHANYILTSSL